MFLWFQNRVKSPNSVRHQSASGKRACSARTKQDRFKLITHTNRWPWDYYPAKTWIGQVASRPSSDHLKKLPNNSICARTYWSPFLPNYTARANWPEYNLDRVQYRVEQFPESGNPCKAELHLFFVRVVKCWVSNTPVISLNPHTPVR